MGWRVREAMNSSSRLSRHVTGRPVFQVAKAATSSTTTSCLEP